MPAKRCIASTPAVLVPALASSSNFRQACATHAAGVACVKKSYGAPHTKAVTHEQFDASDASHDPWSIVGKIALVFEDHAIAKSDTPLIDAIKARQPRCSS